MSYQQELRKLLAELISMHSFPATFEVTVAKPGTFEMKVSRLGPPPNPEAIFDLSGGLTPRIQRLVAAWFVENMAQPDAAAVTNPATV